MASIFLPREICRFLYLYSMLSLLRKLNHLNSLEASIKASQTYVNGRVRCRAYKGTISVLGRSSATESLYDMNESSMDEIAGFAPSDTSGFIGVQAIRLKKWGQKKADAGERM